MLRSVLSIKNIVEAFKTNLKTYLFVCMFTNTMLKILPIIYSLSFLIKNRFCLRNIFLLSTENMKKVEFIKL